MEEWDVYDLNRNLKGYRHVRGTPIDDGDYRLVVHVAIFNSKNEMLIQQRQPFKSGWSNYWDVSVGGSVTAGETSQQGAHRELLEEIGYDYDFSNTRPQLTMNFNHGFDDWYIVEDDVDLEHLSLQYEEVQAVRWAGIDEIYEKIQKNEFIPYHKELIALLYATRNSYGAHCADEK